VARQDGSGSQAPDAGADYELVFDDYGIALTRSGREIGAGLAIKIPEAPGSLLIKYRRLP